MTLLIFALAAVAAALGTQLASVLLVAAAVSAALGSSMVAAATWTAALVAGAMWLTGVRRRMAPAIGGAAAVLAAAAAPNAAAVLGLWVAGTLAFLIAADVGRDETSRRWGTAFALADLPFLAAVIAGSGAGFQGWPSGARGFVAVALLVTAAAKASCAASPRPSDEAPVLVATRTQVVVAVLLAVQAAPHAIAQAIVVVGAVAFAVVPHLATDAVVDVMQEAALLAVVASSSILGWGPRGWAWGVLAAGTLIHHLRLSTKRPSLASVASLLTRGSVIGLAFLPVVLAELEGAARVRPAAGAVLIVAFVYGLASRMRPVPRARLRRAPRLVEFAPLAFAAAAVASSLWAPLLSSPHPPAGVAIEWLPVWGAVVIGMAAIVGAFVPGLVRGPARARPPERLQLPAVPLKGLASRPFVLEGLAALLVVVAGAMWAVGAFRGFL
jgi:hypothetical protein